MPELTCCLMPSYNHWRRSTQMSTSRRFPFRLKLNRLSIINLTSQGFQLRWVKYSSESEKGGVHVYVEHCILKGLHCELLFRKWTKVECLLCSYGTFSYLKKQTNKHAANSVFIHPLCMNICQHFLWTHHTYDCTFPSCGDLCGGNKNDFCMYSISSLHSTRFYIDCLFGAADKCRRTLSMSRLYLYFFS